MISRQDYEPMDEHDDYFVDEYLKQRREEPSDGYEMAPESFSTKEEGGIELPSDAESDVGANNISKTRHMNADSSENRELDDIMKPVLRAKCFSSTSKQTAALIFL